MKYRTLGRTGLKVSEISQGTWAFGNNVYGGVDEKQGIATIHEGIDLGINLMDTAPQYGTDKQDGVAEIVLGNALKGKRDKVFISTKFGRNPCIAGGSSQFYKQRVIDSVEESLKRLQTDHIDILFFHSPFSINEIQDDVWEGLEQVKKQGKIRFVGHSISMFQDTEHMAREWAADGRIDLVQVVLSLMNREAEQLVNDFHDMNIGVVARECLANGFLAGVFTKHTVFKKGTLNARYTKEELADRIDQVNAFEFLVRDDITHMAQAALRWVLDQKGVSTVLSGAKNNMELLGATTASNAKPLTSQELEKAKRLLLKNYEAA